MCNVDISRPKIDIQLSLECLEEVEVTCEVHTSGMLFVVFLLVVNLWSSTCGRYV